MNEDFKVGSRVRYKDSECPVLNGHKKGEIYTISKIDDDAIAWFENEKDPCLICRLELAKEPEMIAIFEGETSPKFLDINRLFSIAEDCFGMDTPEEVKSNLEKGRLQIFKLVPIKVGIVIHEPEIKIY